MPFSETSVISVWPFVWCKGSRYISSFNARCVTFQNGKGRCYADMASWLIRLSVFKVQWQRTPSMAVNESRITVCITSIQNRPTVVKNKMLDDLLHVLSYYFLVCLMCVWFFFISSFKFFRILILFLCRMSLADCFIQTNFKCIEITIY